MVCLCRGEFHYAHLADALGIVHYSVKCGGKSSLLRFVERTVSSRLQQVEQRDKKLRYRIESARCREFSGERTRPECCARRLAERMSRDAGFGIHARI